MSIDTLHVCMYAPSSDGGHALYTQELLAASRGGRSWAGYRAGAGDQRGSRGRTPDLGVSNYTIFPRLVPRREYSIALVWAWSRMIHSTRREQIFLDWLTGRKDLNIIHIQEWTRWLAPRHFRELRRRGLAVVMTVHNIVIHSL